MKRNRLLYYLLNWGLEIEEIEGNRLVVNYIYINDVFKLENYGGFFRYGRCGEYSDDRDKKKC